MELMRKYKINLKNDVKDIRKDKIRHGGINGKGDKISFTNYYMELNGEPFFGICGEFHYSRYDCRYWEEEILKMKMCGINIVATYVIWIHHEEEQGIFDWEGNKNLRHFIELCHKHGMYVIIRIGPFAHGEVRNGGIPDWLFGRPFELRSNDEEYLYFVKRFYGEISKQIKGLLYKDGGCVIGTQLENEYMHSGAPAEITTGLSYDWITAGRDGVQHMLKLKELAVAAGIETPLYTCTGWGGSPTPTEEMLPLYGGYAFWPWIFTGDDESRPKKHPATKGYIYRDYHNNESAGFDGFNPTYEPESCPYACCEMGGGMFNSYKYRFILPPESVEAMSNIKVASGCNFIGYYMFHGGSNPHGKRTPYLNEYVTPKISYDFQAALGEYGQVRDHYRMLKRLHYFYTGFEKELCRQKTVLPYDTGDMDPHDVKTLRYAARVRNGSGFIFINNYQDHVETIEQKDVSILLRLAREDIRIPQNGGLSLAKDCSCILPFNVNLDGVLLKYACAQLITKIECDGHQYYVFYTPKGMKGEYCFDTSSLKHVEIDNGHSTTTENTALVYTAENCMSHIQLITKEDKTIHICSLTDEESMKFWKVDVWGRERFIITDGDLIVVNGQIKLHCVDKKEATVSIFPDVEKDISITGGKLIEQSKRGIFSSYTVCPEAKEILCNVQKVSPAKVKISFNNKNFEGLKELYLRIDYTGDIGYAFIDGKLINDNFCNGASWEIGLMRFKEELIEKGMYLYISPIKQGAKVKVDSAMAARAEVVDKEIAEIHAIEFIPVYEVSMI